MHEKGFVHRDLKPENILVNLKNQPKVCDFGFCRKLPNFNESMSDYVATRWYRSPELILTPKYRE